jgi:hypothetical protein
VDQFWASAGLVALGAAVSLGTTLIVELVKSKRERERDAAAAARTLAAAEVQVERERIARGRDHAKEVFDELNDLWNRTVTRHEMNFESAEAKELLGRVRSTHLLIADETTRVAIADAVWGLSSPQALDSLELPERERNPLVSVLLRAREVAAAHLRGESPDPEAVDFLRRVRALLEDYTAWVLDE